MSGKWMTLIGERADYTACFKEWTSNPGIAICVCSDGLERRIQTSHLYGWSDADYPAQRVGRKWDVIEKTIHVIICTPEKIVDVEAKNTDTPMNIFESNHIDYSSPRFFMIDGCRVSRLDTPFHELAWRIGYHKESTRYVLGVLLPCGYGGA